LTGDEGEDLDLEAPKIYEPIDSYEQLSERFKMFQAQYNEVIRGSQMDLVFFKVHNAHCSLFLFVKIQHVNNKSSRRYKVKNQYEECYMTSVQQLKTTKCM